MFGAWTNSNQNPIQVAYLTGHLLFLMLLIGATWSLCGPRSSTHQTNEERFSSAALVRVELQADYNPPFLPPRKVYSLVIDAPEQVWKLAEAAKRSQLGHWGRPRCRLSRDKITLTLTSRSGDKYKAVACRCAACTEGSPCGREPAYKDDDINDPLLQELAALGFPLLQDMPPPP